MRTEIFQSHKEFLERADKLINGVTLEFAHGHPDFSNDNETNNGCWNCEGCKYCTGCDACIDCSDCSNLVCSNNQANLSVYNSKGDTEMNTATTSICVANSESNMIANDTTQETFTNEEIIITTQKQILEEIIVVREMVRAKDLLTEAIAESEFSIDDAAAFIQTMTKLDISPNNIQELLKKLKYISTDEAIDRLEFFERENDIDSVRETMEKVDELGGMDGIEKFMELCEEYGGSDEVEEGMDLLTDNGGVEKIKEMIEFVNEAGGLPIMEEKLTALRQIQNITSEIE